ncbi:C-type lectin 37Db-like [Drosophila hydei]|uniref:C-type lectin 37Db-like n=1 Tax=Drosophila hydei TaxID=7224 RepID=A0A6J1M7R1_DROHY|nr:C-type lectin 37Db-like [Drosophila hydei]
MKAVQIALLSWLLIGQGSCNETLSEVDRIDSFDKCQIALNAVASPSEQLRQQNDVLQYLKELINNKYPTWAAAEPKQFQEVGSKLYYVEEDNKLNWFTASDVCSSMGAHLAYFKDGAEYEALSNHLLNLTLSKSKDARFWMDVNDICAPGAYTSLTTGKNISYAYWETNRPDNFDDEHCVELRIKQKRFVMNDIKCLSEKYFICQKEKQK